MSSSNVEKDLLDLKKSLQDAQNKGSTSQIISQLKQLEKYTINATILRKTEMGLFVNKLKTHSDDEVSRRAKDIVKNWKSQVTKETSSTSTSVKTEKSEKSSSGSSTPSSRPTVNTVAANQHSNGSSGASSPMTPTEVKDRTIRTDGIRIKTTGNDARDKCIELLYQALGTNSNAESERLLRKSTDIEAIVFEKLGTDGTPNPEYRKRIRTIFLNLRNKSNPKLRESVVDGDIAVKEFCEYSTQDMASAEAKARDLEIQRQNMFLAKGAEEQQAETDMFKCGKCKGRKTRYYQMQTRSADEPMTTFVTCINCGNRWKFS